MISELSIPVLDQTTEVVVLSRWLKREGDAVRQGEAVCEIETDKATVELPAPADGLLRKILLETGAEVPPRTVVALIGPADEALPDIDPFYLTARKVVPAPAARPAAASAAPAAPVVPAAPPARVAVSPRARRLAETHGVDLASITGSGPGGRILEEDVQQAAAKKLVPAGDRAARAAADRVSRAWQTIPHFYTSITVDMTRATKRVAAAGAGATFTDCMALALAHTLPHHPRLNGFWQDDGLQPAAEVRLGLVVETEAGLVIPALQDLRGRSLDAISAERALLVSQARARKLTAESLSSPTFTLSNMGPGHIHQFTAVISPPQVAILSVGSIQPRPIVAGGQVAARPCATFTLGADHRAVDGRQAARFLEQLKTWLETEL